MENSDIDDDFMLGIDLDGVFDTEQLEHEKALNKARKLKRRQELIEENGPLYYKKLTPEEKKTQNLEKIREKRRATRKRQKAERREKLSALSIEERKQHFQKEADKKEAQETKLSKGPKNGFKICIDCGFEKKMVKKEIRSLIVQLSLIYGRMRSTDNLFDLTIANYSGLVKELSQGKNMEDTWHATFDPRSLKEMIFSKHFEDKEIIYLSPDAEEELTEFDRSKVYVIGGLVDGSVHLDQTSMKAKEIGIKSQKLPLEKLREKFPFRTCLNLNTVFNIVDDFLSFEDIEKAIFENIPKRFKTGKTKPNKKIKGLNE